MLRQQEAPRQGGFWGEEEARKEAGAGVRGGCADRAGSPCWCQRTDCSPASSASSPGRRFFAPGAEGQARRQHVPSSPSSLRSSSLGSGCFLQPGWGDAVGAHLCVLHYPSRGSTGSSVVQVRIPLRAVIPVPGENLPRSHPGRDKKCVPSNVEAASTYEGLSVSFSLCDLNARENSLKEERLITAHGFRDHSRSKGSAALGRGKAERHS